MGELTTKLRTEKGELGAKILRLKGFTESEKFQQIDPMQQKLLKIQYGAMVTYWECLEARTELLEKSETT
jgi:hypothetical protein